MHAGQLRYHVSNIVSYVQEMELLLFIVLGEVGGGLYRGYLGLGERQEYIYM